MSTYTAILLITWGGQMRWVVMIMMWWCVHPAYAAVTMAGELKQKGDKVIIQTVKPLSASAAAGVRPGDMLVAINGLPIRYVTQAETLLGRMPEKSDFVVIVERRGFVFPLNIINGRVHEQLANRNINSVEDQVINCTMEPTIECAKAIAFNLRYKKMRHQLAHFSSVVRFAMTMGDSKTAESYARKALATFHASQDASYAYWQAAHIVDMVTLLDVALSERTVSQILMLFEKNPKTAMRDMFMLAELLTNSGYEKEAVLFAEEGLARYQLASESERIRQGIYLQKLGFVWGRAKDTVSISAFAEENQALLFDVGEHYYKGILRAASMENDLTLFAEGMNDAMKIAMQSTADKTAGMAVMIVRNSWYAGNFKGVEYVTAWMEKFVKRYPQSEYFVEMVYSLAEIYAIQGNITSAVEVLETYLVDERKNLRFQGKVKIALNAANSRGKAIILLNESKDFAALLDSIFHGVMTMKRKGIKAVKYLKTSDIERFFSIYAALNGNAFRVTAYKDQYFSANTYSQIVKGLLEVGKLQRALEWGVRYRDRYGDKKHVKKTLIAVYRAFGAFANSKLDNVLLRSAYTKDFATYFRLERYKRYYWTGEFEKAAELLRVMGNAKRELLKQGVFVNDDCSICQY